MCVRVVEELTDVAEVSSVVGAGVVEVSSVVGVGVGVEVVSGIGSGVRLALFAAMAEDTLAQAAASRELIPAAVVLDASTRVVRVTVGGGTVSDTTFPEPSWVIREGKGRPMGKEDESTCARIPRAVNIRLFAGMLEGLTFHASFNALSLHFHVRYTTTRPVYGTSMPFRIYTDVIQEGFLCELSASLHGN